MTSPADNTPKPPAEGGSVPPRKETFLAHYPRKLKLGVTGALLVLIILPFVMGGGPEDMEGKGHKRIATQITGADTEQAMVNRPAPVPAMNPLEEHKTSDVQEDAGPEESSVFMAPAPDPGLVEDTPLGALPRISEDGRQPWQVYARPFNNSDKRPRIAIVIVDLGLSRVETDAAIERLPPAVTLAFDVQSPVVGAWCARARQAGHETLLSLPMEPFDYPRSDPGPDTLLTNIPNSDNIQRLNKALMQANGYIGITTLTGSRFTTDPAKMAPILEILHKRGLMVFDARIAPHSAITDLARTAHIPVAVNTQRIDRNLSPAAIDETLSQLEQTARLNGKAVAMAPPLPIIIDRLAVWSKKLNRDGIALAPLSAMAQ